MKNLLPALVALSLLVGCSDEAKLKELESAMKAQEERLLTLQEKQLLAQKEKELLALKQKEEAARFKKERELLASKQREEVARLRKERTELKTELNKIREVALSEAEKLQIQLAELKKQIAEKLAAEKANEEKQIAEKLAAGKASAWKNRTIPIRVAKKTSLSGARNTSDYGTYANFHRQGKLGNLQAKIVDGHQFQVTWKYEPAGNRRGVGGWPYPARLIFAVYDENGVLLNQIKSSDNGRLTLGQMEFIKRGSTAWKVSQPIARDAARILVYFKK